MNRAIGFGQLILPSTHLDFGLRYFLLQLSGNHGLKPWLSRRILLVPTGYFTLPQYHGLTLIVLTALPNRWWGKDKIVIWLGNRGSECAVTWLPGFGFDSGRSHACRFSHAEQR